MRKNKDLEMLPDYESVNIQNCRYGNKPLNYWCECCPRDLRKKSRSKNRKKTLRDHRRNSQKARDL